VSGFGLWSVLHPRIAQYLDDPSRCAAGASRNARIAPLDSASIAYASAPAESALAEEAVARAHAAHSRAA